MDTWHFFFFFILLSTVKARATGVLPQGDNVNVMHEKAPISEVFRVSLAKLKDEKKQPTNQWGVSLADILGISLNKVKYCSTPSSSDVDAVDAKFFLEEDLRINTTMMLHFVKRKLNKFPSRAIPEFIPSSKSFDEVLTRFSIDPFSTQAKIVKEVCDMCERPPLEDEEKTCVNSLETMLAFANVQLGFNLFRLSTQVHDRKRSTVNKQYTITMEPKKVGNGKVLPCHILPYPSAVYYCHKLHSTRAYKVLMIGANGAKVSVITVCHADTSKWNPQHLAFQQLKVKPGSNVICHFTVEDDIIWLST